MFIPCGFSSWVYSNSYQTGNSVSQNTDEMCTITIHTRTQSSNVTTTTTYDPGPTADNWTVTYQDPTTYTSDSGNVFTHGQKHSVGQVTSDPAQISSTTETLEDGSVVNTIVYQRKTVYKIGSESLKLGYKRWWYMEQTEERTEVITISREDPLDSTSEKNILVKKGTTISPFDLNINGFKQYGYYKDSSFTTFFDFSDPIISDCDIYLKYVEKAADLSDKINGLVNSTLNLYDTYRGGSSGNYNVFDDPSYDEKTKTVFLSSCTLSSGSTVNLTYGDNEVYLTPNTGAVDSSDLAKHRTEDDTSLAEDYVGNTYIGDRDCYLRMCLTGNVTIKGTLNVGAKIGGYSVFSYYSYIIGGYTEIDLKGYDLVIDGGTLNAYGIIKDSVGGGRIIVKNSGNVMCTLTISDGRGRDQTPFGYGKGQAPFTEYKFSYIRAPIIAYNGTSVNAYLKFDLLNLGISNIIFSIIGTSNTTSNFSWANSNSTDFVEIKPYNLTIGTKYPVTDESAQSSNVIYKELYYQRCRFIFNADIIVNKEIDLKASCILNSYNVNLTIDLTRVDVPISPFFDFILKTGHYMDIYPKISFYPGSSFYTETNTTLNFKYRGSVTYPNLGKSVLGQELIIPSETRYIAGGILAYTKNINEYNGYTPVGFNKGIYSITEYWNYVKPYNHQVNSTLTFDEGITDKYHISGNIDFCSDAIESIKDIANKGKLNTYDMKAELYSGFWFNSDNTKVSKTYECAVHYNCVPLISNSKAYLYDGTYQLEGTYNINSGIFSFSSERYFLKVDTDMYQDGSSSSNQSSSIDRTVNVERVQIIFNNCLIKDINGSYYVYYGGILVPVLSNIDETIGTYTELRINAQKFHSNKDADTAVHPNAPYYSDVTITWNSSASKWKYSKFTNKT